MTHKPSVNILPQAQLGKSEVTVLTNHSSKEENPTQAMKAIPVQPVTTTPGCQFIINGNKTITSSETIINIGRSQDNDIILEEPTTSRHHVQIRWRFGVYTLFDTHSSAGTRVNNKPVTEHHLQDGDVIRIGSSTIVFMYSQAGTSSPGTTQTMQPVDQ
jgi:pSer/pThr/pTyr-binding forkhead associated (FHA) protein